MLKPNFSKQREKKSQKKEREWIRIRRCVRLPERSRRVSTRSIERSNDKDNYTQVSSSSRAMTRRRRRKKEKTTSLLFYANQSRRQKKCRFARSLAKVFDTKTMRHTHPSLLPRSFCCGAVRIEFVHLVVRASLFGDTHLFFFSHVWNLKNSTVRVKQKKRTDRVRT